MNFNIPKPPAQSWYFKTDITALYSWCEKVVAAIARTLRNLDDSNITSISPSKLMSGNVGKCSLTIDESGITITGGTFKIQNEDGTQYIALDENGNITIETGGGSG